MDKEPTCVGSLSLEDVERIMGANGTTNTSRLESSTVSSELSEQARKFAIILPQDDSRAGDNEGVRGIQSTSESEPGYS